MPLLLEFFFMVIMTRCNYKYFNVKCQLLILSSQVRGLRYRYSQIPFVLILVTFLIQLYKKTFIFSLQSTSLLQLLQSRKKLIFLQVTRLCVLLVIRDLIEVKRFCGQINRVSQCLHKDARVFVKSLSEMINTISYSEVELNLPFSSYLKFSEKSIKSKHFDAKGERIV